MLEYILSHGIGWLIGIVGIGVTALATHLYKRYSLLKLVRNASLALLHDRLYQACHFFTRQGWIDIDDLRNLEKLHDAYTPLGGNGTGTTMYNKCQQLPQHPPYEKGKTDES